MKTPITLIFSIVIVATNAGSFSVALIKDYMKLNHLKSVLFVDCRHNLSTLSETVEYFRYHGIWINSLDMSASGDFNYEKLFIRLEHAFCIVFNLECAETVDFVKEFSIRNMFHMERFFLMFSSTLKLAYDKLSSQNINSDAEITLVVPNNYQEYQVYEVYNPSWIRHGRLNVRKISSWKHMTSFTQLTNQSKIQRRHDYGGLTFQSVVTLTSIPKNKTFLEHLKSDEFVYLDSMTRYVFRLYELIKEMYNFKSEYRIASSWGFLDSNGTWHGTVGVLKRKEVDFATTGFRREDERYGALEIMSETKFVQVLKFIFRHPKSVNVLSVFLSPFGYDVWNQIVIFAVLFVCIMKQIYSVENHRSVKSFFKNGAPLSENSYSSSFLTVCGIICQQGSHRNSPLQSSRVLIFTIVVYSLFIYQFYSSFIVGSLLTEAPKTIKTMKHLLHSNIELGMDQVPYIRDIFKRIKEESSAKLYHKLMEHQEKTVMPLQKGLDLVKKGGFAFNTDVISAYNILKDMLNDNEKCEMQEIAYIEEIPISVGVPNKSPLREMMKISIRRFAETGIISFHLKYWLGTRPKCINNQVIIAPVDIVHFSAALYVLLIGLLVSIAICLIENTVMRLQQRYNINKSSIK